MVLTFLYHDFERRSHQGEERSRKTDSVVRKQWHVHLDQTLRKFKIFLIGFEQEFFSNVSAAK